MVAQLDTDLRSELEVFTTPGGFTYSVPAWADRLDVVVLGGGAGGSVGGVDVAGNGGRSGVWKAFTVLRGDSRWGSTIAGWVGAGGRRGTLTESPGLGADSGVEIDNPVTFPLSPAGQTWPGDSPGSVAYAGQVYVGGDQQNRYGANGNPPGGGGAGVVAPHSAGGEGAPGAVWIYAQQLFARTSAAARSFATPAAVAVFPAHAVEVSSYASPGNFTFLIPEWCDAIDVVMLSGGAGGGGGGTSSSRPGQQGFGGPAGVWAKRTFIRGRDFSQRARSVSVRVGAGGAGGIPAALGCDGGDSSVFVGGKSASAPGGKAVASGGVAGGAAGNIVYHPSLGLDGTYVGGAAQSTAGIDGQSPGGGGAGGSDGSPGGSGGNGKVWVAAYQAAGSCRSDAGCRSAARGLAVRTDVLWAWAVAARKASPSASWRKAPDLAVIYRGRSNPSAEARTPTAEVTAVDGGSP